MMGATFIGAVTVSQMTVIMILLVPSSYFKNNFLFIVDGTKSIEKMTKLFQDPNKRCVIQFLTACEN